MQRFSKIAIPIFVTMGLFVLIMDSKTAIAGAAEGVQLCIHTLIPSLFPFFIISGYFCKVYSQIKLPFLTPIMHTCGIPQGAESMLVLGLLGGYPVGAKTIADAFSSGQIDSKSAKRMLGFCNNAGPSFVFGVIGGMFEKPLIPWLLFIIQILSSLITGCILPDKSCTKITRMNNQSASFSKCFEGSIRSTASVCGWVILFRVFIKILQRWILWLFPEGLQVIAMGVLELSNGCIGLQGIEDEGLRFVLSSAFLSFGGICVYLQTKSVTATLGTGCYLTGKFIQTLLSVILSGIIQQFISGSHRSTTIRLISIPIIVLLVCIGYMYKQQKKNNCSNFCTSVV